MQCHNNGTCRCRQGFVGYKCDKCELNYFQNRATHQCEECPVCYGLVQKQVSRQTSWMSHQMPCLFASVLVFAIHCRLTITVEIKASVTYEPKRLFASRYLPPAAAFSRTPNLTPS